jgi:hypothetical protein
MEGGSATQPSGRHDAELVEERAVGGDVGVPGREEPLAVDDRIGAREIS